MGCCEIETGDMNMTTPTPCHDAFTAGQALLLRTEEIGQRALDLVNAHTEAA